MYKMIELNEFETIEVYIARCGKVVDISFICCEACNEDCICYQNLMDEIV